MADTPEALLTAALARLSLVTQLVRILLRDRAHANNQTPEEILHWAEDIKQFFEAKPMGIVAEGYITAAVDEFFNLLASDVREDRENR